MGRSNSERRLLSAAWTMKCDAFRTHNGIAITGKAVADQGEVTRRDEHERWVGIGERTQAPH